MNEDIYTEIPPKVELEDFVKRFWKFNNPSKDELRYTILPDGYFDVIVSISPHKKLVVTLYGLWCNSLEVIVPAETTVIGISCKPLADEYIFGQGISHLLNENKVLSIQFLSIDQIPYNDLAVWVENISNKMIALLNEGEALEHKKKQLFELLFETNGTLKISKLSAMLFWEARQLNRYFNEKFGMSLKAYCNIIRCFSSTMDIRNGNLFPTNDYYDQSHFIKQIKKHTGVKPRSFMKTKMTVFYNLKPFPKNSFAIQ